MAKKEKSLAEKAKLARDKASGTKEVKIYKPSTPKNYFEGTDREVSRGVRVLSRAGKVISTRDNAGALGTKDVAKVKKVDSDVYNMLSKLAKGKALKGAEAEKAIQKVFKSVARTAGAERQRTATRGEAQVKRGKEKRSNTNLLK